MVSVVEVLEIIQYSALVVRSGYTGNVLVLRVACTVVVCKVVLHGTETWPIRKENQAALQRAEMRMVRWMCGIKLQDRVRSKGLRERLGLDDIILVLQQYRLRWYGHVLHKEDNDCVKKCMEYEVEGARPRG